MTVAEVSVFAIFLGPIFAVIMTRWLDRRREKSNRRMEVFKTLMRTRRNTIYPEHVGALNLIEVEFAKDKKVIEKWRDLMQHFGAEHLRKGNEQSAEDDSLESKNQKDKTFYDRLAQERQSLLAKLLHAIANELNFKIEQLEIFEGGYTPQGWADIELEQSAARKFVVDLYLGRRSLPIGVWDYTQASSQSVETDASRDSAEDSSD